MSELKKMPKPKEALIACNCCGVTIGLIGRFGLERDGRVGVPSACPRCKYALEDMRKAYHFISWSSQAARLAAVVCF